MGAVKELVTDVSENITVQREFTCPACGKINIVNQLPGYSLDEFNQACQDHPENYWKELMDGKIVYRIQHDSKHAHCPTSCQ